MGSTLSLTTSAGSSGLVDGIKGTCLCCELGMGVHMSQRM